MNKYIILPFVMVGFLFGAVSGAYGGGRMPADAVALLDMEGQYYHLGHNLHADLSLSPQKEQAYSKLSTVNYLMRGGLISWGTEVKILKVLRNKLLFEEVDKGRKYIYEFHHKTRKSVKLKDHLSRVFIKDIDSLRKKVAGLSKVDQDGIYEGRALVGMSKQGILIALGNPPEFANKKDLMAVRDWHYWESRHDKLIISFNREGLVSRIID